MKSHRGIEHSARREPAAGWTLLGLAIGLLCPAIGLRASTAADFLAGTVAKSGNELVDLPYRYLVPPGYDAARRYPLIVFLHGSGERGNDNAAQLARDGNGSLQLVAGRNQTEFPAFMLAPQLGFGSTWDQNALGQTMRAMAALAAEYSIDPDRIYVTGLSLGGAGTYQFVALYPEVFAAAVPMSAYLNSDVTRMSGVPMWAFHAADDLSVAVTQGDLAVAFLRATGDQVIYTRYAVGGHGIWPTAYGNPYLMPWLMAQRRHQAAAGVPLIDIASPAKLPSLETQGPLVVSGTAAFPGGTAFDVYGTYTPVNVGPLADGFGAAQASGSAEWSIAPAPSDATATYFMVFARGPTWGMGLVGGGATTVNNLVWIIPRSASPTPPAIAVTLPSATGSWTTAEPRVDVAGIVMVPAGGSMLQQITWTNDRGGQGVATRSAANDSWSVVGVALRPGDNRITIRAMNSVSVWSSTQLVTHSTQAPELAAPTIATQPQSVVVAPGADAMLAVTATGVGPLSYQWDKNGQAIAGATSDTLMMSAVQPSDAGNYAVRVANAAGSCVSTLVAVWVSTTSVPSGRLENLSVRAVAGTDDQTLIIGFVVSGEGGLPVLIRGWGPALKASPFNIAGALADPLLALFQGNSRTAENDDWGGGSTAVAAANAVGAYPFEARSKDAALFASVSPGANSAHVIAASGGAGVGMAEVYDASGSVAGIASARLVNLSARAHVGTGDAVLIGGFVVGGSGPLTVLVRAVGPGLKQFGVSDRLTDPTIELHANEAVLQSNDNWSEASNAVEAAEWSAKVGFPLSAESKDAAILATLMPGAYTAVIRGVNATTGVALLEIYEVRSATGRF